MREILFRGKRIDDGAWVYGSFLLDGEAHRPLEKEHLSFSKCYIIPETDRDNINTRFNDGSYYLQTVGYHVIPETVGQFTGLTDKNGKKIFEGDIVEGHCHSQWRHDVQRCEIAYGRDGFEARHHVQCGEEKRYYAYKVLFSKDVVVIGNIHDNQELLEV